MPEPTSPTHESVTTLRPTGDVLADIAHLRSIGWGDSDLRRHGLDQQGAGVTEAYRRFWRTAGEIARVMNDGGINPVIVKSWRVYPFVDSNVDVIAPRGSGRAFITALVTSGRWTSPRAYDGLVQQSFEPRKLKLPPMGADLLPAHVYDGLRWRHQPSFDIARVAPDLLTVTTSLTHLFPDEKAPWAQATFRSPTLEFELILQAVHALEENYRLSIGEIVHVRALLEASDIDWSAVESLELSLGVSGATHRLRELLAGPRYLPSSGGWEDAFMSIPLRHVAGYSANRSVGLLRNGRVVAASAMFLSGTVWPVAAAGYRALKRGRR